MALVLADRVQETTTTAGTGTVTLAGAVSGYQSFAVIGNGNTTYYTITNNSAWEVGIGTYASAGTSLARTTILASSSGGAAITLSGTSNVFADYPSGKSVNLDASGGITIGSNILAISSTGAVTSPGLETATGYKGLPVNTQSGNYTLLVGDMGKYIYCTNAGAQAITIPSGTGIPIGAAVTLVNNGTTAVTFGLTGITFYKAGTSATYSGTLGVRGMATLLKVATDTWFISGAGLS